MRRLLSLLGAMPLAIPLVLAAPAGAASMSDQWQWPLTPRPVVVAAFKLPDQRWAPGHRGIDLLGALGEPVSAVDGGTVSFAGVIAGRGVVVVDHGALRSTYEPVLAEVRRGDAVVAGQVVGTLEAVSSHCHPRVCLHLGVRRGEDYLDPLPLLGPREVRLKPLSGVAPFVSRYDPPAGRSLSAADPSDAAPHGSATVHDSVPMGTAALATGAVLAAAAVGTRRRGRTGHRPTEPGSGYARG